MVKNILNYSYYPGCSLHASGKEYDESTRSLFKALKTRPSGGSGLVLLRCHSGPQRRRAAVAFALRQELQPGRCRSQGISLLPVPPVSRG